MCATDARNATESVADGLAQDSQAPFDGCYHSEWVSTRVHALQKSLETTRFRVVVKAVVPSDGIARLLQVEAWGKP